MSSIAGFIAVPPQQSGTGMLMRMLAAQQRRGGHVRLAHAHDGMAIGQASHHVGDGKPLSYPHGKEIQVAIDGGIFNLDELYEGLHNGGSDPAQRTPAAIVAQLYLRFGDDFVQRIDGQFAIAVWDARRQRLLLARDRFGMRPLVHARAGGGLWYASQASGLLAALPHLGALDVRGLAQTFTCWGPLGTTTAFAGVDTLPPGHLLVAERHGEPEVRSYWQPLFNATPDAGHDCLASATEQLRALLTRAVQVRMRGTTPAVAYLSGGLDSSAVAALMAAEGHQPLRTFSVSFADAEFDESAHQDVIARHIGAQHETLRVSRADIGAAFPELVGQVEMPLLRTAGVPLMLLAGHVRRRGFTVALTGEGADEVLAGYDLFKEAKIRRFWARRPDSRWRPLLLGRLYGYLEHSPVANPAFAQAFFGQGMEYLDRPVFAHVPRWNTSRRALAFFSPELQQQLTDIDVIADVERLLPADIMEWPALSRDQFVELCTMSSGYLLPAQGDRPSMARGVHTRMPFLDHGLVEFANRLPPRWKLRGLTEKYILREAVADLLPESILARTKQPYRAPDSSSFFVDGKPLDYVAELFSETRIRNAGYFDPARTTRLFNKCRAGSATGFGDNQAFVGILSTMLLDQQLVHDRAAPSTDAAISNHPPGERTHDATTSPD